MANPTWPASLPQSLPLEVTETVLDPRVQTSMDSGPPKVRRRFTSIVRIYDIPDGVWLFDEEQKATLDSFVVTDLAGGVLAFDWWDPWPQAGTKTFQLISLPSYRVVIPGPNRKFAISFKLREGV